MKSKRVSHTLKVIRLESDLEVRARLQTQKCPAQKPGSMFSLLLLGSPRRRAHHWKCPYRVSFKAPGPPVSACWLHGSQFLVQRICLAPLRATVSSGPTTLVRGSGGCKGTTESGGQLWGKTGLCELEAIPRGACS